MIKRPQSRFQLEARCQVWRNKCERLRKENEAFRRNSHNVNVARMKELSAQLVIAVEAGWHIGTFSNLVELNKLIQEM